jgi:hypothetical protein
MERVVFLVEATGQRIGCLLNPATVVVTRTAGVRTRSSTSGQLTGSTLMDDPLVFTGGGNTELDVELLFDLSLSERIAENHEDVRELTRPLIMLAENSQETQGSRRPPLVRFLWGKSWNIPGIIVAIAERFDSFTRGGVPLRSWVTLKLSRVADPTESIFDEFPASPTPVDMSDLDTEPLGVVTTAGDGGESGDFGGVRLDNIAAETLDNPLLWRLLAIYNDLDDPLSVEPGQVLAVPDPESAGGPS